MNKAFLDNIHAVHFIGLGGVGVSALARLMLSRGISVSGSDHVPSSLTEKLSILGAQVFVGHDAKVISDSLDLVVYSPAVSDDNPELCTARERGIPAYSYPQALGLVAEGKRTVAVSGTHGKTTTTAMIAEILVEAKRSPTVIVGSLLKKFGSNFITGTSDIFVVEACEYKRSFLSLSPEILVITNIDDDHLDYYGTLEGVQTAFAELAQKVPPTGVIVCNPHDLRLSPILESTTASIVDYTKEVFSMSLPLYGEHNKKNAQAALAVVRLLEVSNEEAMECLSKFEGTWRRMEYKGVALSGALVYDDYAHHPTEVRAALQGFRAKFPLGRVRVIFQPHLYSRTKLLLNDFAQSFGDADEVIVAPIYAAREKPDPEISSEKLTHVLNAYHDSVRSGGDFMEIETYLRRTMQKGDIVVTMGAGDVYKIGENILG